MKNNYFSAFIFLLVGFTFISCRNIKTNDDASSLYRILVGNKYGFINSKGKIVIDPQYDAAFWSFTDGICYVNLGDKKYLIDKNGTRVKELPDSIITVLNFVDKLALIRSYNESGADGINIFVQSEGIMNTNAELILPAIYYDVSVNIDGNDTFIRVRKHNQKYFMTDANGNMLGTECDSILTGFSQGLCAIKLNGKWGYMDKTGKIVIEPIYDFARVFTQDGISRVRKGNENMFIDKTGKCITSVDKTLSGMVHNRALVVLDGEKCLIDRNGCKICNIDCDKIYSFEDDFMATIISNGKAQKIDTMGNVVLKTDYGYIGTFNENIALAEHKDRWGLIDINGNEVVKLEHSGFYSNDNNDNIYIFYDYNKSSQLVLSYYDKNGTLLWKDIPSRSVSKPQFYPTREEFVEYFDANISILDPIEGIYYVTYKDYYQDRNNYSNIGLNRSNSTFYAIVREEPNQNDFGAYLIDGSNKCWVNKFVKLGDSNNYAIIKTDDDVNYSSEGKVKLEDPYEFDFRLETGKNDWYNFFVTYEFIRDYPSVSDLEQYQTPEWTGTGFAIADGYIATNYHVTNGAKTIRIKGIKGEMNKSYKGVVIASDKQYDLSIIKIIDADFETFGKIPYRIGKSMIEVGDNVFVLGYPMITSMGNEIKLTEGIVSSSTGYKGDESMYQISAAVQPGNSGGPLFNEDGDIVGVICASHSKAENANYAIKVSYLNRLISTSGYNIELNPKNRIHNKKLSSKVKCLKDYVFIIECSSR